MSEPIFQKTNFQRPLHVVVKYLGDIAERPTALVHCTKIVLVKPQIFRNVTSQFLLSCVKIHVAAVTSESYSIVINRPMSKLTITNVG